MINIFQKNQENNYLCLEKIKKKKSYKNKERKIKTTKKIIESKKSSSTDEKIEIKKIKKQPNQKKSII